jgi:general secretion pathway protein H
LQDEAAGSIRFFPDGSSTGGRVMIAAGNEKLSVDVNWLTGRVSIL